MALSDRGIGTLRTVGASNARHAPQALASPTNVVFRRSAPAFASLALLPPSRAPRARLPHVCAYGKGSDPQFDRRAALASGAADASSSPLPRPVRGSALPSPPSRSRSSSPRPAQASTTSVPVGPGTSVPGGGSTARGRSSSFVLSPALLSSYRQLAPFPGPVPASASGPSPDSAAPRRPSAPPLRRPLRIAMFVEPSPFTYVSGYRNRYTNAIVHLQRLGCQVLVVTPGRPMWGPLGAGGRAARPQPAEFCGAKVHEVLSVGIPWWYPELPLSLGAGRSTKEVVRAFAPDLIHCTSPGLLTLGAWAHARSLDVPIVLAYHTHVPKYLASYNIGHLGPLFWSLLRTFHGKAARTLVTSQPLADELHQQGVGKRTGAKETEAEEPQGDARPLHAQGKQLEEDWFGAVAARRANASGSPFASTETPSTASTPRASASTSVFSSLFSAFSSPSSSSSSSPSFSAASSPTPVSSTIEVWQRGVDADLFTPAAGSAAARDALLRGDAEALRAIGKAMEEAKEKEGEKSGTVESALGVRCKTPHGLSIDRASKSSASSSAAGADAMSSSSVPSAGQSKKHLLLSVGRLGSEKNLSFLRPILERLPDAHLAFVGDGPQRASLEAEFAGLPVSFLGMQSGKALSAAYASADVFVMPSESETLGFVVLEAMASALPPVAVRAGGIPDVVGDKEGKAALLYEPGDVDGAVQRIRALLDSPERRKAMGRAARNEVSKWDWGAATAKLLSSTYLPVVEDARRRKGLGSLMAPDLDDDSWQWGTDSDAEWIMGGEGI